MRAAGRAGRTVVLRLRFDDYTRATRSHTLRKATADTTPLLAAARALLARRAARDRSPWHHADRCLGGQPRTTTRCSLSCRSSRDPGSDLDAAVDAVRDRFGSAALTRAVLLGREPGVEMPLLPD